MTGPRTILHVDDDDAIREVVSLVLHGIGGFTVVSAECGDQALGLAKEHRPDLVLLDVMMPRMDGPQTLALLRSDPATQNIPVVFLTAKVLRRDLAKLRGLGAADIIEKPFRARQLVDAVNEVMRLHPR